MLLNIILRFTFGKPTSKLSEADV